MTKRILITGATSGIGEAAAVKFASEGFNLIITGRRSERLEKLKDRMTKEYDVEVLTLCFDVQDRIATETALASLPQQDFAIDILLNNAGLALGKDHFDTASIEDWDTMIDTNVKGLLYSTRASLPYLKKGKFPHIINIGSTAGQEVYESGNVYCATKYAVDAITKAMRIDLLSDNIKVTSINPGAAKTEFSSVRFKGNTEKASSTYEGFTPLSAVDIADAIFYTATLPPHVCVNDLTITATQQANSIYINRSGKLFD